MLMTDIQIAGRNLTREEWLRFVRFRMCWQLIGSGLEVREDQGHV